jgi:uncharacterized protein YifE (UPF0438 family)
MSDSRADFIKVEDFILGEYTRESLILDAGTDNKTGQDLRFCVVCTDNNKVNKCSINSTSSYTKLSNISSRFSTLFNSP